MKNLSSWLITFFVIIFWAFRVIVAVCGTMGKEFIVAPIDNNIEVILLFVVLLLVPFIFKRKLLAGLIYFLAYGWYFGRGLLTNVLLMVKGETLSINTYFEMFISLIAVSLALITVLDIFYDKARSKNPINKETDWFYKNEQYDRKLDERADKNNYRTL